MQKLTAIILFSRDVGEFDRLYFLYTQENGLIKAMGKGVRKPAARLAGHLEPGTLSEIYIARSRGIGQITSAITLKDFDNLKKNFKTLSEILAVFRFFVKNFAEGERDERIFDLLIEYLDNLGYKESERQILTESFWWQLFDFLGSRPETMKCSNCGAKLNNEEQKFFSAVQGGVVCKRCSLKKSELSRISSDQIKLLRVFLVNSPSSIIKVRVDKKVLYGLERLRKEFKRYNF